MRLCQIKMKDWWYEFLGVFGEWQIVSWDYFAVWPKILSSKVWYFILQELRKDRRLLNRDWYLQIFSSLRQRGLIEGEIGHGETSWEDTIDIYKKVAKRNEISESVPGSLSNAVLWTCHLASFSLNFSFNQRNLKEWPLRALLKNTVLWFWGPEQECWLWEMKMWGREEGI